MQPRSAVPLRPGRQHPRIEPELALPGAGLGLPAVRAGGDPAGAEGASVLEHDAVAGAHHRRLQGLQQGRAGLHDRRPQPADGHGQAEGVHRGQDGGQQGGGQEGPEDAGEEVSHWRLPSAKMKF